MTIEQIFARNLRRRRNDKGLSQEALAAQAGLDRTYISALERSQYSATIGTIERLALALGVAAHEMLSP